MGQFSLLRNKGTDKVIKQPHLRNRYSTYQRDRHCMKIQRDVHILLKRDQLRNSTEYFQLSLKSATKLILLAGSVIYFF